MGEHGKWQGEGLANIRASQLITVCEPAQSARRPNVHMRMFEINNWTLMS